MFEYHLLKSKLLASVESLEKLSASGSWRLKFIFRHGNIFFYHFTRPKVVDFRTQCKYNIVKTDALMSVQQLNGYTQEGWTLQSIVPWEKYMYYYFVKEKSSLGDVN